MTGRLLADRLSPRRRHTRPPRYARPCVHSTYAQFHALLDTLHFLAIEDYALVLRLMRREINASLAEHEAMRAKLAATFSQDRRGYRAPSSHWQVKFAAWLFRRDEKRRRRP